MPGYIHCVGALALCGVLLGGCTVPALTIVPTTLDDAVEGRAYSVTLDSTADSSTEWTISAGSLPDGVSLNRYAGIIVGTPGESGTFEFVVKVAQINNDGIQGTQTYVLVVIPALNISNTEVADGRVGESYSHDFGVTGGTPPYTMTLVGAPGGLSFDASTGVLSGTPVSQADDLALQLTVTDSGASPQTTVENMTLTIKPPPVEIVTTSLPDGTVGQSYSATVQAQNGTPNPGSDDGDNAYKFSVVDGLLPTGPTTGDDRFALNTDTGEISGRPLESGTFTFTIKVEDYDDPATTDEKQFTIAITN